MSAPTVWQYRVRSDKGAWLADVVLRSDGFFATVSDWGNYAFRWTQPGMPFREFVSRLEESPDYVCSKLARADWWDGEKTVKCVKDAILTCRRDGDLSHVQAREEWDALAHVLGGAAEAARDMDRDQFLEWTARTSLNDVYGLARCDYPPDVRAFCREVMPRLAALIRAELAAEAAPKDTRKECTCLDSCRGAAGLGEGWRCALQRPASERTEWSVDPKLSDTGGGQ